MESGIGDVALLREVTLDIEAFTEYSTVARKRARRQKVILKKDKFHVQQSQAQIDIHLTFT